MTRNIAGLYKQAERDLSQGDQTLSDTQVRAKLRAAVRCTNYCDTLSLSEICELDLITAVEADVIKMDPELRPRSPAEFLDAVSRQTREPRATLIDANGRVNPALDPLLLNGAKELYRRKQVAEHPGNEDIAADRTMENFINELNVDFENIRLATTFIPNALPINGGSPFWFDGEAVRGATGMTVEDMALNCPGAMSLEQKVALLKLRLSHLGEDSNNVMGTPQQSQRTTILRMGPALGIEAAHDGDLACMMERFQALVNANTAQNGFPASPYLMMARHLAKASGVLSSLTLDKDAQLTRELCTTKLSGLLELTKTELQRPEKSGVMDPASDPSIPFHCDKVALMAKAARPLTGTEIEAEAVAQYKALEASREVIVAPDSKDLNRQLLNYLDDRWAAYGLSQSGEIGGTHESTIGQNSSSSSVDANGRSDSVPHNQSPVLRAKAREVLRLGGLPLTDEGIRTVAEIIHESAFYDGPLFAHKAALLGYQHAELIHVHGWYMSKQASATDGRIEGNYILNRAESLGKEHGQDWTGDQPRILHTVTDPAYQIDRTRWHGNWSAIVEQAISANAADVHTWLNSLGDTEMAAQLERQITEVEPSASITPLISMVRSFYTEVESKSRSVLPLGTEGAITEEGMSRSYDFTYASENDRAVLTRRPAHLPRKLEASSAYDDVHTVPSRSVQGTNNVMDALRASEAGTIPNDSPFGVTIALPLIRNGSLSAPPVANLDHSLRWTDSRVEGMAEAALSIINKSPLARRLARYASERSMQPFALTIAEGAPTISLDQKTITLAPAQSIEAQSYVGAAARAPFRADAVFLTQWLRAVTEMPAFDGARPDLERGTLPVLINQIMYEANMQYPDRIMYGGTTAATEGQAEYSISEARLRALAEDRELAPGFRNSHEPNLKILGTPGHDRETVRAQKAVMKRLNAALLWQGVSDRAATTEPFQWRTENEAVSNDAVAFSTAFNTLRDTNGYFNGMVNQWMDLQGQSNQWVAKFDVPRTFGNSGKPWAIDRQARTVTFFAGPTYYSTPFSPDEVTWERRAVGALVELVCGREAPVLLPHAAKHNRGYETLMTDIMLGSPTATHAVSAEFSTGPDVLWASIFHAAKAADEEDVFMKSAADRLVLPG